MFVSAAAQRTQMWDARLATYPWLADLAHDEHMIDLVLSTCETEEQHRECYAHFAERHRRQRVQKEAYTAAARRGLDFRGRLQSMRECTFEE